MRLHLLTFVKIWDIIAKKEKEGSAMYSDFILYINQFIDKEELTFISLLCLSIFTTLIIFAIAVYFGYIYEQTLKTAIDKWYSGKPLTKKEERVFYEYQDFKESRNK